jgi:hypothetical protein
MKKSTYITLCWAPIDLVNVSTMLNYVVHNLSRCSDSPESLTASKKLHKILRDIKSIALNLATIQPEKWDTEDESTLTE